MCKIRLLRRLVKQRLDMAIEEIFELLERNIAEFQEELCRGKEENDALNLHVSLHEADMQKMLGESQEEVPSEQHQEPPAEPSHIKEEKEECHPGFQQMLVYREKEPECTSSVKQEPKHMWSSPKGARLEDADTITIALTGVHVKSEEGEGQSTRLHQGPSERHRQHMTTESIKQRRSRAGTASKAAETQRRYRQRRDADPDRRRKYLEKEKERSEAKKQSRDRNRPRTLVRPEMPPNLLAATQFPEKHPQPFSLDHWKLS
nr:uncharacterized protein LOC125976248 isoform X2 [Syngnathus scovelli]